jgi:hypothetical protein
MKDNPNISEKLKTALDWWESQSGKGLMCHKKFGHYNYIRLGDLAILSIYKDNVENPLVKENSDLLQQNRELVEANNDLMDKIGSLTGYLELCLKGRFPMELPAVIEEAKELLTKHSKDV